MFLIKIQTGNMIRSAVTFLFGSANTWLACLELINKYNPYKDFWTGFIATLVIVAIVLCGGLTALLIRDWLKKIKWA